MKNLIKKILKEETEGFLDSTEDDWEWAENTEYNPFKMYMENEYDYVGVVVNDENEDEISQKGFFSLGYNWGRWEDGIPTFKNAQTNGVEYPYSLWVDDAELLMYSNHLDDDHDDEIIIDNPFI